jgi:1-aminocyclopropane-1-carboxylate deaminase/D-cysteine desulfhydrase-like pyridoxal-dependent ACC family enzyme
VITLPSAVETFNFRGRKFYVKRDDQLDLYLSGNKFRKLYTLYHTPSSQYKKIISYGGTQSNAMLSLAYLCHLKGWVFEYYSKPLSASLQNTPEGNLKQALKFGMSLVEVAHHVYEKRVQELFFSCDAQTLLIPQGGADALAEAGVQTLADEIASWQQCHDIENLHVVTPSGTGTTAFYLASQLNVPCYTTAVVGTNAYLKAEMSALGTVPNNLHVISTNKKFHFAKPYKEYLEIYWELKAGGIEFDLLYAPKMWLSLLEHLEQLEGNILYVHSGGVYGNGTMLQRYRHKGWMQ